MRWLQAVWAIYQKDLRVEGRSRESVTVMFTFGLLVTVIMGFATDGDREAMQRVFPGMLWIVILFTSLLGFHRTFAQEKAGDTVAGLLMAPVDRSCVYYGKLAASLTFLFLVEIVVVPLFFVLSSQPVPEHPGTLAAVVLMGTIGLAAAGTLLAGLVASTRAGEVLLPLALFPVVVPILIAAVQASRGILMPDLFDPDRIALWFKVLIVYDLVFLALPLLVFDSLLEV